MRKTFVCDDSMIINIPIRKDSDRRSRVMPQEFQCVFRDTFKVFAYNGFPKPLGAAQCLTGVSLVSIGLMFYQSSADMLLIFPSILFVLCGMLTYAAGCAPNMRVTKVSFCLNIISFVESVVLLCLSLLDHHFFQEVTSHELKLQTGIKATAAGLFVVQCLIALFLIYWQSKAVCRQHFNMLPIVQMRLED